MKYDCIVLGVGGIGSFAFLSAARKGWSVLGIDQFGAVHNKGSSHGRTRIIRTAYFEHPNYVPLARWAWASWLDLQSNADVKLIQKTGLLQVGRADGPVIRGVMRSAVEHGIEIQQLDSASIAERFPALRLPTGSTAIFEETAGFLLIENCVANAIQKAKAAGGQFAADCKIDGVKLNGGEIEVFAAGDRFKTERLVIATGPWSNQLLSDFNFEIEVIRKQQHWFQFDRPDVKYQYGFPAFLFETGDGCFYGFPEIDYLGVKVAEHSGGRIIDNPDLLDQRCDVGELRATESFIDRTFNFGKRRFVHHSVCMYSMSADGHFIIDRHPDCERIVFVAGLSGHGFKFAPVIGNRLVEMLEGIDDPMFDFFKIQSRSLSKN